MGFVVISAALAHGSEGADNQQKWGKNIMEKSGCTLPFRTEPAGEGCGGVA